MRAVAGVAEQFVDGGLGRLRQALDELDRAWPAYYEAVGRLDSELWPDAPPSNVGALMVIQPAGDGGWYDYFPDQLLARRARSNHVVIHDNQKPSLDMLLDQVLPAVKHRRVGICLHGAVVSDPGGGPWIDAPDLIDSAPFEIATDGGVGVPSDFDAPPNIRAILGKSFSRIPGRS